MQNNNTNQGKEINFIQKIIFKALQLDSILRSHVVSISHLVDSNNEMETKLLKLRTEIDQEIVKIQNNLEVVANSIPKKTLKTKAKKVIHKKKRKTLA